MKILIEYNDNEIDFPQIKSAEYLGNWVIRLGFGDGARREVNFKPFLTRSRHPGIRRYLTEQKFRQFKITDGNLNWNDYELIFPLEDLYKGKITGTGSEEN